MESFVLKFRIFDTKPIFFKTLAKREYWSICNVLYKRGDGGICAERHAF